MWKKENFIYFEHIKIHLSKLYTLLKYERSIEEQLHIYERIKLTELENTSKRAYGKGNVIQRNGTI